MPGSYIQFKSFISFSFFLIWVITLVNAEKNRNYFCPSQQISFNAGVSFFDTTTNKKIVSAYLSALKNFDHQKMKTFIHSSMSFPDKTMQGYRDFEKNMDTKWSYTIIRANEDSVFAEENEDNIFYDCLGVGERLQTYCYLLKDGLIFQTVQISMHHLHGEYRPALTKFISWLQNTDAGDDSLLLKNNNLVFDSTSAIRMKPWLIRWKKLQN